MEDEPARADEQHRQVGRAFRRDRQAGLRVRHPDRGRPAPDRRTGRLMLGEAPALDPLPASDMALNPAVPHPPFAWFIGVPADWAVLDTNPQSWQHNAERLVDDRFSGRRLRAAERRAALDFLEQLVAECQRAGAALSMVQLGRLSTGAAGSAGMHLGWFDSAPNKAGPGLLHRDTASTVPPGATSRVRSTVLQLFLPIAGTTWTAVLSAATPHPEMEPVLENLIVAVARSILPAGDIDEQTGVDAVAGGPDA